MSSLSTAESRVEDLHKGIHEKHLANMAGLKKALIDALVEYYKNHKEFMTPHPPEKEGLNEVSIFIHNRPELETIRESIGDQNVKMKELYSMYMEAMPLAKIKYEEQKKKNG